MTAVSLLVLLACWAAGVLLATGGRWLAANRLADVRLPVRQVLGAQLAGTALNRVVPAGGGLLATHLGLLRRSSVDGPGLTAALGGYAAGGGLAHLVVVAAGGALLLAGAHGAPLHLAPPGGRMLAIAVGTVAGAAVLATLMLVRRGASRGGVRGRLVALGRAVRDGAVQVRRRPGTVTLLMLVQTGTALLAGTALWAALLSTGTAVALPTVLAVSLLTSGLLAALPAPAGTGPVEAGLIGGLGLAGVAVGPAAAGVALFRLVTHWLPVPLGIAAAALLARAAAAGRGGRLLRPAAACAPEPEVDHGAQPRLTPQTRRRSRPASGGRPTTLRPGMVPTTVAAVSSP